MKQRSPSLFRIAGTAVILLFLLAGYVGWRAWEDSTPPAWKQRIDALPLIDVSWSFPDTPEGRACEALRQISAIIVNDIYRRDRWTMEEAEFLDEIIRAGYPPAGREDWGTHEEAWKAGVQEEAVSVVILRIGYGAPIEPEARELLVQSLFSELQAPTWNRRWSTASSIIGGRPLFEIPGMRQRIEAAIESLDENPEFQESLRMRLAGFDEAVAGLNRYEQLKENADNATAP